MVLRRTHTHTQRTPKPVFGFIKLTFPWKTFVGNIVGHRSSNRSQGHDQASVLGTNRGGEDAPYAHNKLGLSPKGTKPCLLYYLNRPKPRPCLMTRLQIKQRRVVPLI